MKYDFVLFLVFYLDDPFKTVKLKQNRARKDGKRNGASKRN